MSDAMMVRAPKLYKPANKPKPHNLTDVNQSDKDVIDYEIAKQFLSEDAMELLTGKKAVKLHVDEVKYNDTRYNDTREKVIAISIIAIVWIIAAFLIIKYGGF